MPVCIRSWLWLCAQKTEVLFTWPRDQKWWKWGERPWQSNAHPLPTIRLLLGLIHLSVSNINEMSVSLRAKMVNKSNLQCSLPQRWNGHLRWRRQNHLHTPLPFLAGPTTPSVRPLPPCPASGATTWARETPTSPPPDLPPRSPRIHAPQRPAWGA